MGGEWGLGAALAMEKIPTNRRGFFSGLLQEGYSFGYLLAAVVYLVLHEAFGLGWRWLFAFSILPALITLIIRSRVKESEVWETDQASARSPPRPRPRRVPQPGRSSADSSSWCCLMTAFNWMSHGTQDVYPDVPQGDRQRRCRARRVHRPDHRDHLQHRRDHRRSRLRRPVRTVRPAPDHRVLCGARAADRADLRVLTHGRDAGARARS